MELTDHAFAEDFNVSQEYAVLVVDVRRATVSLSFRSNHLQVLITAGLVVFLNACFEFADEGQELTQQVILTSLTNIFSRHLHGLPKVADVRLLACVFSPSLFVTMLRSSQSPHHNPRTNPVLRAGT